MFSAITITTAFIATIMAIHVVTFFDKRRLSIPTMTTAAIGLVVSTYCIVAGVYLAAGWQDPFATTDPKQLAYAAAEARGKGGLIILAIRLWPYVLIGFGGFFGFGYWVALRRHFRWSLHAHAMTAAEAEKIVHDYGELLLSSPILPGCVADTRKLPHPKERIKQALVIALRSTQDPMVREKIKFGYLALAEYQDGVGGAVLGVDLTKINVNTDSDEILRRVVSQGAGMEKWTPVVKADQQALISELETHGLW